MDGVIVHDMKTVSSVIHELTTILSVSIGFWLFINVLPWGMHERLIMFK